jgi:hypothetical protein
MSGKTEKAEDKPIEILAAKPHESVFCHRCKVVGNYTKEWRRVWQGDKEEVQFARREHNISECVATLCATQEEGLGFFCIPNRPT